jgi:hypothetical protein
MTGVVHLPGAVDDRDPASPSRRGVRWAPVAGPAVEEDALPRAQLQVDQLRLLGLHGGESGPLSQGLKRVEILESTQNTPCTRYMTCMEVCAKRPTQGVQVSQGRWWGFN